MPKHRYDAFIWERYSDLIISKTEITNHNLATIFELYSCVKLEDLYKQPFFMYADIDPTFKEKNKMSKNDTGIDCSNLIDIIVQCKLRTNSLNLGDCGNFFASQNIRDTILKKTIVRWNNLIIARNSDCSLSKNLRERLDFEMFIDHQFDKQEMIAYCENLIGNPPEIIKENIKFELRDYQIESINLIKNNNQNIIICLPTGTGKNVVIIYNFENDKKYLILVPRVILTEQLRDEIIRHYPNLKNKIQIIGDGNEIFDNKKNITICVYNSVSTVKPYTDTFYKIFIDEAHHINKPEIYIQDDEIINEQNDGPVDEPIDEPIDEPVNVKFQDIFMDDNIKDAEQQNDNIVVKIEDIIKEQIDDSSDDTLSEDTKDDSEDELCKEKYMKIIKGLTKYNNNIYLSATIDEVDGFLYYKKDIREMIEKGYLCDYTIHIPIFSDLAGNEKVCEYLINNYRTMIVYCESHKEGQIITNLFNKIQNKSAEYIDCNTGRRTRNEIIKRYKNGEIPFLINVRVLTEGFDAPNTQGVILLHLPSSNETLIQIIGRALRLYPNKTFAKIVLPFTTNEDENNINNFLKVMAKNDSRIRKAYESKSLGGYIEIDKVKNIKNETIEDEEQNEDLNDDIEFKYDMIYDRLGILKNGTEIWEQKLEQVKKYIDENNKRPSTHDKKIKKLGEWISTQLVSYKIKSSIMKNQKIYDQWTNFVNDDKYKKYFMSNEDEWNNNLEQAKKYIDENNKRPTKNDQSVKIEMLGSWVSTQCKSYITKTHIMSTQEIYDQWTNFINDGKYKQYFISDNEVWLTNLELIKQYIDKNNKRPTQQDKNKEIKILGNWISKQQQNYKVKSHIMKNQEIYDQWMNFINSDKYKKYFISNNVEWTHNLERVKQYIYENQKQPYQKDKNKEIKILGYWINNQQKNYKKKIEIMKNQEIYDQWTNFINDDKFKQYFISNDEEWISNLERVKRYIDKNNKRPTQQDKNKEINLLGSWIGNQQKNYKMKLKIMKNQKIYDLWTNLINDDKYKQYFISNNEEWDNNLTRVKLYMDEYQKRPSNVDKNKEIKILGQWVSHQQTNYKTKSNIMKNQEIYDHFTNFLIEYKKYFISYDEEWNNNLIRVRHYIDENHKRPLGSNKNKEIKILSEWISNQQQKYKTKKDIMKNQEIYDHFTNFLVEYKKYFPSIEISKPTIKLNKMDSNIDITKIKEYVENGRHFIDKIKNIS
jgi:superfamily II DNA or RNA helicase